jgi:hypothetical protein
VALNHIHFLTKTNPPRRVLEFGVNQSCFFPGNPWLIEAYANVAPHPFASVIGQEIFQSGIIPGKSIFIIDVSGAGLVCRVPA